MPRLLTKKLYHRTSRFAADKILTEGFRDTTTLLGGIELTGVWLSNRPLDPDEGTKTSEVLLKVKLRLPTKEFNYFELVEEGKPYREWCIPSKRVNAGAIEEVKDVWALEDSH